MFKKILLVLLLSQSVVLAQNLLSNPESIVYDSLYHRYLISNSATGHIVAMDTLGNQSYFVTGQQCFGGITIMDSILFVACREYGVKGFNLHNGSLILNIPIAGATFSNDIAADNSGFLYVSYTLDNRIYKIDVRSQNYWIFINSGLNTPNGLCFDQENDRLMICSYVYNSPIQAVDLTDSTISTVANTSLDALDGFTADGNGNYYVSSWQTNTVYVFAGGFADPPQMFANMSDDPADICYDLTNDVLAVPLYNLSQIEFVQGFAPVEMNGSFNTPADFELLNNYPNPFNASTIVEFKLPAASWIKMEIVDITGRTISVPINGYRATGIHRFTWNAGDTPSGTYFCKLTACGHSEVKTMILLK